MNVVLLIAGLFFPAIAWFSFIAASVQSSRSEGRSPSGVYVPFIGPILLDLWILRMDAPGWMLAIPWVADLGTIMFLIAMPAFVGEMWRTSRFTRLFVLEGSKGIESVRVSFHKGGHYVMTKNWTRPPGEMGVLMVGEPGTYEQEGDTIELTSHTDCVRRFEKRDGLYGVADPDSDERYQLDGWTLRAASA